MEQLLTPEEIQRLRDVSIYTILGLTNTGRRIMIRCPIHAERKPSMVIYPDESYHCYGCSAHGRGAIDFLMSMGANFIETCEELSTYIGK